MWQDRNDVADGKREEAGRHPEVQPKQREKQV